MTEEHKKKISLALKGKRHTKESITKMSLSKKGKHYSPNTEFKKGSSGFIGKHSEKSKEKNRIAHLKENLSKETLDKMRKNNPMKNNPLAREKSSISHKKYYQEHPEAIELIKRNRAKQKSTNLGIKFSREKYPNFGNRGKKYPKELYPNFGVRKNRDKLIFPIKDTSIEVKIQNFLKELHIEFVSHYYISEITNKYQCDIFIPEQTIITNDGIIQIKQKTIIECDGCYWHGCYICNRMINEKQSKQIEKDNFRTKELVELGFKVVRLREHDIRKMELNDFKEGIK